MAMSSHAALLGLARAYLDLVAATDAAHGNPNDRPHAASQRAVIHDLILTALGLTRADPFNPIAWAKAVVASAARRDARIEDFYASVPFAFNQPLERYRLHHGMRLAAFAAFLGITENDYLRLVAGDATSHLRPPDESPTSSARCPGSSTRSRHYRAPRNAIIWMLRSVRLRLMATTTSIPSRVR